MKHLINLVILFLLSLSLSACVTTKIVKEEVYITEIKVVELPESMLKVCKVTPPFDSKVYQTSNRDKKESMLFDLSKSLYVDLKNCNDQIDSLRDLYLDKKKLYEQKQ